jgi:hypothetical protein
VFSGEQIEISRIAWKLNLQRATRRGNCSSDMLQQEGANLIDDAGALPDKSFAHPVQRLQVKLIDCLGSDEFHRRALHRFSDRLGVAEIVFLPLEYARTYFAGISRAS